MNLGILFSILAAVSWGIVYVLEQKVLATMSVLRAFFYYSFLSLVVVMPVIYFFDREALTFIDFKRGPLKILIIAFIAGLCAEVLILSSVQRVGATLASLFEILYPLFTVFFAYHLLKQPVHWLTLVGGIIMVAGAMLVIYVNRL